MSTLPRFHGQRSKHRLALTLVELLVVVGVVSVLAAIILPSVKNMLTDRKSSQSAVMVRNFIESARARAIGKNRSVAVVFERVSSRARVVGVDQFESSTASGTITSADTNFIPYNSCVRLSLSEEPLPVSDRTIGLPVVFTARALGDGLTPAIPTGVYTGNDSLVDADQAFGLPEVRIFRVTSPNNMDGSPSNDINLSQMLGEYLLAGNEIALGNVSRRLTIMSPRNRMAHKNSYDNDGSIWFAVSNEIGFDGLQETALGPVMPLAPGNAFAEFKVYSKPRPVYSQTVQLPKGMCIDLSLSGFSFERPGFPEYRLRFASDWVMTGAAGTPLPPQLRPISIVFSPSGQLSHVYANEPFDPLLASYTGNAARIDAVDDVFLHIGKIDQVTMPVDAAGNRSSASIYAAEAVGARQNITDTSSYVVRLSPKSGSITTAPARSYRTQIGVLGLNPATLSLGDLVQLVRSGAYSSTATAQ